MNCFSMLAIICAVICLVSLMIYDVWVNEPIRRQKRNDESEVTLDGVGKQVHNLVDKKQNLQWRVIYVNGGTLIILGSERPWQPQVEK